MYNHAPENYICPICLAVQEVESKDTLIKQHDIVFKDDLVTAFIGSFFIGNNPGHIIIVPNKHYENMYDLPKEEAHRISEIAKISASALKATRNCSGIMILQNNEPASGQHAFHYHLHVFPRFENDQLHQHIDNKRVSTPEERQPYAEPIRNYFKK